MAIGHGLKDGEKLGLPFPATAQRQVSSWFVQDEHAGIDWELHPGTPICAMYDGTVEIPWTTQKYVRGAHPVEWLSNNYTTKRDGLGNFSSQCAAHTQAPNPPAGRAWATVAADEERCGLAGFRTCIKNSRLRNGRLGVVPASPDNKLSVSRP